MKSAIVLLLELSICAVLKGNGIDAISNILASIFIFFFSVAFILDIQSSKLASYSSSLSAGFFFRVLLLFFDRFGKDIYNLPNSGADSEMYFYNAVWLSKGIIKPSARGFSQLFGYIFRVIGTNRLFAQFLVMIFSIITLIVVTNIIDSFKTDHKKKERAVAFIALLPNYAILSSIFLRESLVSMFVAISLYNFLEYFRKKSIISLIFAIFPVFMGMFFHSGIAGILIGYGIVILFLKSDSEESSSFSIRFLLAALFGIATFFIYLRYGDVFFSKFLGIDELSDVAAISTRGGSSYAAYVGDSSSPSRFLLFSIPRIVFFLFSPFPWQWRSLSDVIASLFSGLYYMLVVFHVIRYLCRKNNNANRSLIKCLAIIAFCGVLVFAWGVSNTGTATRHRDKLIAVFAILDALCI